MRRTAITAGGAAALTVMAGLAACSGGGPQRGLVAGALNPPDEARVPRPLRCRAAPGAAPGDSAAHARLAAIVRSPTGGAAAQAATVRTAWPGLGTFEALEARACAALAADRVRNAEYEAFVDSVIPTVLAAAPATADSAFRSRVPRLRTPPPGAVFSVSPRRTAVSWDSVPGATHYLVEVHALVPVYIRPPGGGEPVFDHLEWTPHGGGLHSATVRAPRALFYFGGAQPGRWRVRAVGPRGVTSRPSEWREFTHTR